MASSAQRPEGKETEDGSESDVDNTPKVDADGDSAASRPKVQGGARSRVETPPPSGLRQPKVPRPKVKTPDAEVATTDPGKVKASKPWQDPEYEPTLVDYLSLLVVVVAFVTVAYLGYQQLVAMVDANGDGVVDVGTLVDKDADGVPDVPHVMDTSATCHAKGATIAKIFLSPVYYSGMFVYYMLCPVIYFKQFIQQVLGAVWHVVFYLPNMLFSVIGSICKWIGFKLVELLVLLRLDRVIAGLVVLVPLGFITLWVSLFSKNVGKALGFSRSVGLLTFLVVFAFWCQFIIYQWGLEDFTWMVMHFVVCPFQFVAGGAAEVGHSSSYWSAVLTLSKVTQ